MKKSILICLIGLFMLAGTQYTQAQTKEETIEWIKEKLEKYGGWGNGAFYTDVEVNPCYISFVRVFVDLSGKARLSFNPSLIKEWTVGGNKTYIETDAKAIEKYDLKDLDKSFQNYFMLQNREPEIHERMIKALLHLATFCEQKKEAF